MKKVAKMTMFGMAISLGFSAYSQNAPIGSGAPYSGNLYHTGGNFGIGTANPTVPLYVSTMGYEIGIFNSNFSHFHIRRISGGNTINLYNEFIGLGGTPKLSLGVKNYEESLMINELGKVGIGTTMPAEQLHLFGDQIIENTGLDNPTLTFLSNQSVTAADIAFKRTGSLRNLIRMDEDIDGATFDLQDRTSGSLESRLYIRGNGNVGIGSTAPTAKLAIYQSSNSDYALYVENNGGQGKGVWIRGGTASGEEHPLLKVSRYNATATDVLFQVDGMSGITRAREIIVDMNTWADCVFDPMHHLMPLNELEKFIETNKHLPSIPSESAVGQTGINVAEMDALLLEKIEELTLYVIDLHKQMEIMESENDELKALLNK